MRPINRFLLDNNIRISHNPCISPDFCLDWPALGARLTAAPVKERPNTRFETAAGRWTLLEDETTCDCAWKLQPREKGAGATRSTMAWRWPMASSHFPATWENLLRLKNAVQEHDPDSTIFPTAGANLGRSTLGIGARFTTLHWPAVEWAMHALNLGVTANQNSIPRELVFDVDAMLEGRLDTVPFPFIGTSVPEGHQGQSVEGMSHGCVLSKLKTGFHRRRIAWSFNADHQPIGGKFDAREDALVRGCVLASYITFDLSPELAQTHAPADAASWVKANVPSDSDRPRSIACRVRRPHPRRRGVFEAARLRLAGAREDEAPRRQVPRRAGKSLYDRGGKAVSPRAVHRRAARVDDARNDRRHAVVVRSARHAHQFRGAGFGFQKNTPYPDNVELRRSSRSSGPCAARSTRASAFIPDRESRQKTIR